MKWRAYRIVAYQLAAGVVQQRKVRVALREKVHSGCRFSRLYEWVSVWARVDEEEEGETGREGEEGKE